MDWSKMDMDEVRYYCKDVESFFDCGPFGLQMEEIVMMFAYYGIESFTVEDIQEFYRRMEIRKTKSDGILKPIPSQIQKVADRMKNIRRIDSHTFQIVSTEFGLYFHFDTSMYADQIKQGYQDHRIHPELYWREVKTNPENTENIENTEKGDGNGNERNLQS